MARDTTPKESPLVAVAMPDGTTFLGIKDSSYSENGVISLRDYVVVLTHKFNEEQKNESIGETARSTYNDPRISSRKTGSRVDLYLDGAAVHHFT